MVSKGCCWPLVAGSTAISSHLNRNEEYGLQRELLSAGGEELLQVGPQQLHHEGVVLSAWTVVVNLQYVLRIVLVQYVARCIRAQKSMSHASKAGFLITRKI